MIRPLDWGLRKTGRFVHATETDAGFVAVRAEEARLVDGWIVCELLDANVRG